MWEPIDKATIGGGCFRHRILLKRRSEVPPRLESHIVLVFAAELFRGAFCFPGRFNGGVSADRSMRMFPLSSVLFPQGVMPLHIFEARYLAMINEAIDDDGTFGIVLIERGSEVGGGDVRFGVGTTAQIVRAGFVERDRMAIVVSGTNRVRIDGWLTDDPYPTAMVSDFPDRDVTVDLTFPVEAAFRSWRRLVAFASEIGAEVGDGQLTLPEDPVDAIWTLCSVSALEQIDRQRLLEIDQPGERADRLRICLDEQAELLEARLAGGFS